MRHKFEFRARDLNASDRIRWCRDNLGPRGNRWDFSGGFRITIQIRHDEDADLYNKAWRFWNVLKGNNKTESHHNS